MKRSTRLALPGGALVHCLLLMALAFVALSSASCVIVYRSADVAEVDLEAAGQADPESGLSFVRIDNPLKAHLASGETIIFPDGATIRDAVMYGDAQWYAFGSDVGVDTSVALTFDDVAAVEGFQTKTAIAKSVIVSTLMTSFVTFGSAYLLKLLFGSCPTVYEISPDDNQAILQAELFPNSIAPLLEMRDVDRLTVRPDDDSRIRLEVRNEALETHYINHVELLEAKHAPGALVAPQDNGEPAALLDFIDGGRATDRTGRDVTAALKHRDEVVYETDDRVLSNVSTSDFRDTIDYTLALDGRQLDSVWVYLRLRNSLLGTVFFYDQMLAGQGPRSIKWLADDLEVISNVVALGDYYIRNMGLRIEVRRDRDYEEVGRVREVGPIAFDEIAVRVPVTDPDSLRIRLRFIADAWRIDQLAVATTAHRPDMETIPISTITSAGASPAWLDMVRNGVERSDTEYAMTTPGQSFVVSYQVDEEPSERGRTYLLSMQGYYVEWIRGQWLRDNPEPRAFVPSDSALVAAMRTWSSDKEAFQAQFFSTKIPTRVE